MSGRLPEWIKPIALADKGTQLDGTMPVRGFPRLGSLLHDGGGAIDISLRFDIDASGQAFVSGHVRGVVRLVCQRCLEPMEHALAAAINLGIVADAEAADRLTGNYEPLIVGNDPVKLADLVEDELILAMPYVAYHGEGHACTEHAETRVQEGGTAESGSVYRPFDVLKDLKKT